MYILLPTPKEMSSSKKSNFDSSSEVKVAAYFQSFPSTSTATTRHDVTASRADTMQSMLRDTPSSRKNILGSSSKAEAAHALKASLASLLSWLLHTFLVLLALSLTSDT